MKKNHKVVITGIGVVLPGALQLADFWHNLKEGISQIDFITRFPTENFPVKVGAELKGFDYTKHLSDLNPRFAKNYNRETLAIMSAMEMARQDAGLAKNTVEPSRVGFVDSSSRAGLAWWEEAWKKYYLEGDTEQLNRYAVLQSMGSNPSTLTAINNNIQGFVTTVTSACVGGHHAAALAFQAIRKGRAELMYVGGHEFPIVQSLMSMYSDPKSCVMSAESENPKNAMKPFDKNRDGFILGEGAIVLCLEQYDHAVLRGAKMYAEMLGSYSYNEASHAMRLDLTGIKASNGLRQLLKVTRRKLSDIDYYCAHGTATYNNDLAESRAFHQLYHGIPQKDWPPMASVKPIYGHTFGAAGVINLAASALMVKNQTLCPTINHREASEECDFDHVQEGYRETKVRNIISMAHSIGSQSSFVALSQPE
ncbi:MAG: beta-ketoacyl-[acyl-carrier-protein] synthase family protein [Spirochaetota bacterium]